MNGGRNLNRITVFILLTFFLPLWLFGQAIEIQSPGKIPEENKGLKVFLAGTIDMGNSENWQAKVTEELKTENVIILNPRREDWNPEWKPIIEEPEFVKQVEWELNALEAADYIIMYFAAESLSPISLLEFGLYAKSGKLLVFCEEGFWRKGNVQITAEKYDVKQFESIEEILNHIKTNIAK